MTDATLVLPEGNFDFSYFISAPGDPDITVSDADLTDGVRNYLEIELCTLDDVPLTRAFWDPDANGGIGLEFNQIVKTVTDLKVNIITSVGGFSGSVDRLPLAIVDIDGSGNINAIFDRRDLFFRLSNPNDLDNEFTWGIKEEPSYSISLTGASGPFLAGESITIGGETAQVIVGGAVSITIKEPTGVNFKSGDGVTGGTSGETALISTIQESFSGVDKSIGDFKEALDAIMTEIKAVKGTRFWYDTGFGSISGIQNLISSRVVNNPSAIDSSYQWDGSNLQITDGNVAPADADVLSFLRIFNSSNDLNLTRQDDGLEIQTIAFSGEPDAGEFTVDFNGSVSDPIAFSDDAAAFQVAWDANIAEAVSITGDFKDGFNIKFTTVADKVAILENSNTLFKDAVAVTTTITETRKGQVADTSIPVADGEVLFIKTPASGNRTFDGIGSGDTNYQTAALGSYVPGDDVYWLAVREGSVLYTRNGAVLAPGEGSSVSGGAIPASLLAILGLSSENTPAVYTSNVRGEQGQSFVKRMSVNTDSIGDSQEDRSMIFRSDNQVVWTGTQLEFTTDLILDVINAKSGVSTQHTILQAASPIVIGNGESIYVNIDREVASENLSVKNSGILAIPAQTQASKDVIVLFKRIDTPDPLAVLHIPFLKQALDEGQSVRLGASGSGGGGIKASFMDPLSTALPSGATVTIDGVAGVDGDTVLYTNLITDNNRVYELSGVGVAIAWSAVRAFGSDFDPEDGDSVRIQKGNAFQEQLSVFNGTSFRVNDVVRYFDENSANFWEQSSIKTSAIVDATTANLFSVNVVGSENMIVEYSIVRGSNKATGSFYITSDGTLAAISGNGAYLGDTQISFVANVVLGNLEVDYTAAATGADATMKYFIKRWSNGIGGPTGIPSYSGPGGSSVAAAGAVQDIQFHGTLGTLDADPKLKWDSAQGALVLNGLVSTALSGSLTINDNQVAPLALFSYVAANFKSAIIEYSIEKSGEYRTGRILVSNGAASGLGFSDDFVETNPLGIVLDGVNATGNVSIRYTSTNTGATGVFKYTIKKWN